MAVQSAGKTPGSFLLEQYAFGTALNGQSLCDLANRPAVEGKGVLAIGGIFYDDRGEKGDGYLPRAVW